MSVVKRKKSGDVNMKEYEDPSMHKKFEHVRQALIESKLEEPQKLTTRDLSVWTGQFIQFMEEFMGRDADPKPLIPKIPSKLLKDYEPGGALCEIFSTLFHYKNTLDWRRFDFKSPAKKDKNLDMLQAVQARLVDQGLLRWPEVYFSPDLDPKVVPRLKDIVKRYQGKIVTSPTKATHIIESAPEADPSEDPELEYLRTIDHSNRMNLIHWWYYPDSYDTWLPATDVQGEQPDPDPPHHGVWRVSSRFLTDLELYNEWMNELDYEIEDDDSADNKGRTRGKGKKGSRKRSSEEEEDAAKRESKKAKVKGRKSTGADDDEDVDVEDAPSTPSKKSKKDDSSTEGSFKIKIPREMMDSAELGYNAGEDESSEAKHTVTKQTPEPLPPQATVTKAPQALPVPSLVQPTQPTPMQAANIVPNNMVPAGTPVPYSATGNPVGGMAKFPAGTGPIANSPVGYPQQSMVAPPAFNQSRLPTPATPPPRGNVNRVPLTPAGKRHDTPTIVSNISQMQTNQPYNPNAQTPTQPNQPQGQNPLAVPELAIAPGAKVETETPTLSTSPFPAHCSWFSMSEIHDTERTALSEFFNGKFPSKTPNVYKEYRDFMINTYIQNPQQYLTQTACRRNLAGDVCAILRVHQFLEHWGLINYHVSPDTGGFIPIPPSQAQVSGSGTDPRSAFYQFASSEKEKANKAKQQVTQKSALRHNVFGQASPQNTCSHCSAVARTRYQAQKGTALTLCPKCFSDGHFPESLSSSDFIQCTDPVSSISARYNTVEHWTDQETLLLLEGIELYNENWDQIAEHVGSKSKEQCLLHFIRLPVEDSFIENHFFGQNEASDVKVSKPTPQPAEQADSEMADAESVTIKAEPSTTEPAEQSLFNNKTLTPFSSTSNPLMMMVAFLASSVHGSVAAAAAQAALACLTKKEEKEEKDDTETEKDKEKEKEPTEGAEAASDSERSKEANELTKQGLQAATAAALSAAVLKSKLFAEKEEREIQSLVMKVISLELKKLELKLKHFSEIEETLDRERIQIDKARQTLYQEKQSIMTAKLQLVQQAQQSQQHQIAQALMAPPQVFVPPPQPQAQPQQGGPMQVLSPQQQQQLQQMQMQQQQQQQLLNSGVGWMANQGQRMGFPAGPVNASPPPPMANHLPPPPINHLPPNHSFTP